MPSASFGPMPSMAAISSTVALRRRSTEPNGAGGLLAVLAHAGAIVEDALGDALFHEKLVVAVGEAVRLVADALEQPQCAGVLRQPEREADGRAGKFPRIPWPGR